MPTDPRFERHRIEVTVAAASAKADGPHVERHMVVAGTEDGESRSGEQPRVRAPSEAWTTSRQPEGVIRAI
jgi:hypothetical protein